MLTKMNLDIKPTLCTNCVSNGNCTMQIELPSVVYCEEHETVEIIPAKLTVSKSPKKDRPQYVGLCATCDFLESCTLKSSESIVLNCEHYQ